LRSVNREHIESPNFETFLQQIVSHGPEFQGYHIPYDSFDSWLSPSQSIHILMIIWFLKQRTKIKIKLFVSFLPNFGTYLELSGPKSVFQNYIQFPSDLSCIRRCSSPLFAVSKCKLQVFNFPSFSEKKIPYSRYTWCARHRVSYPKEGQFLFSNLDNFAKWEIKILIFAAIIDTY
jgi:hypothetical protein